MRAFLGHPVHRTTITENINVSIKVFGSFTLQMIHETHTGFTTMFRMSI